MGSSIFQLRQDLRTVNHDVSVMGICMYRITTAISVERTASSVPLRKQSKLCGKIERPFTSYVERVLQRCSHLYLGLS